jgi:dCTP deaminase
MPFWSTQRVRAEQHQRGNLILPFDPQKVRQGAYELALSRDVLTAPPAKGRSRDGVGKALEIPAGEFAILYTLEAVTVPPGVIAFISIKASLKLDGLINVSGFHVDPGFSSRLKFSVYNAGNLPIFLDYDREAFLIWFSDLDADTIDPYDQSHQHYNQTGVTPRDRQRMSERSHSPAALHRRLKQLERRIRIMFTVVLIVATAILTAILAPLLKDWIAARIARKPKTHAAISASQDDTTAVATEASGASRSAMALPTTASTPKYP